MSNFILYEEIEVADSDQKNFKILAEVFKFSNGKIACSFHLPTASVFVFDNLDQFSAIYCKDKVKLHHIPDKEPEK